MAGMREAHLRDAEAICDFLAWIEKEVNFLVSALATRLRSCCCIHVATMWLVTEVIRHAAWLQLNHINTSGHGIHVSALLCSWRVVPSCRRWRSTSS